MCDLMNIPATSLPYFLNKLEIVYSNSSCKLPESFPRMHVNVLRQSPTFCSEYAK